MNSADVFSLEFDMLTRTSQLAKILERFRATEIGASSQEVQVAVRIEPDHVFAADPCNRCEQAGSTVRGGIQK